MINMLKKNSVNITYVQFDRTSGGGAGHLHTLAHRGDEKPLSVAAILRGVLSAPCRQLPWNQNDEMLVRNARIRSCVLIMPWHTFMIVSCSF